MEYGNYGFRSAVYDQGVPSGKTSDVRGRAARVSRRAWRATWGIVVCASLTAGAAEALAKKSRPGPGRALAKTMVRLAHAGQIPALFGPPKPAVSDPRRSADYYVARDRKLACKVVLQAMVADRVAPWKARRVLKALFDAPLEQGSAPTHGFHTLPVLVRTLKGKGTHGKPIAKLRRRSTEAEAVLDKFAARATLGYELTESLFRRSLNLLVGISEQKVDGLMQATQLSKLFRDHEVRFTAGYALWTIEEQSFLGKRVDRDVLKGALVASGADPQRVEGVMDALYAAPLGRTSPSRYKRARKQGKKFADVPVPEWAAETPNVAWPWTLVLDSQMRIGSGYNAFLSESNGAERLVHQHLETLSSKGSPERDYRVTNIVRLETEGDSVRELVRFALRDAVREFRWGAAIDTIRIAVNQLKTAPPWDPQSALARPYIKTLAQGWSPKWNPIHRVLRKANVGGGQKNGKDLIRMDVVVAAEAMGVPHFSNYLPTLVMQDKGAVNKLVRLAEPTIWRGKGPGKPAYEVHPDGVTLVIDGKGLRVIPVPFPGKSNGRVQQIEDYLSWHQRKAKEAGPKAQAYIGDGDLTWARRMLDQFPSDQKTIFGDYVAAKQSDPPKPD